MSAGIFAKIMVSLSKSATRLKLFPSCKKSKTSMGSNSSLMTKRSSFQLLYRILLLFLLCLMARFVKRVYIQFPFQRLLFSIFKTQHDKAPDCRGVEFGNSDQKQLNTSGAPPDVRRLKKVKH